MDALGLFDLLTPYFFGGVDLGPALHTLLSGVQVDEYDSCHDESGATVWGVARLAPALTNPQFQLGPGAVGLSTGGASAPAASGPGVWDWHDVAFQFRIRIPRTPSATSATVVNAAAAAPAPIPGNVTFTQLFNAWGSSTPTPGTPTDFPDTQFTLDLLLTVATLHVPGLTGATLESNGLLAPDPDHPDVKFVLPKILLTLTQGATLGSVNLTLDSWGAQTIDDPNDTGQAQLFQMIPPLALVKGGRSFGFGLDRLILDTSGTRTPPDLLAKFGLGTDWKGFYAPDVRLFFAPGDQTGFAVDISAHDLIFGLNDGHKLSGDFELDIINQDSDPYLRAVFYDTDGNTIAADCDTKRNSEFTVVLPEKFTCAVEVHSALPPYTLSRSDDPGAKDIPITAESGFAVTSLTQPVNYTITAKSAGNGKSAKMLLHAVPQALSPAPAAVPAPGTDPLTLTPGLAPDNVHKITLLDPAAGKLQFSPMPSAGVQVTITSDKGAQVFTGTLTDTFTRRPPPGETWTISAKWPPVTDPSTAVDTQAYFHYNRPPRTDMPQPPPPGINPHSPYGVPRASDVNDAEMGTAKDSGQSGKFTQTFRPSPGFAAFRQQLPANGNVVVTIYGFASYEHHDPMQGYNLDLSERRAIALAELITACFKQDHSQALVSPTFNILPRGNDQPDPLLPGGLSAKDAWGPAATPDPGYDPSTYWMAHAQFTKVGGVASPAATVTATLTAPPAPKTKSPGPVNIQQPNSKNLSRPDWFRYAKLLVRIQQSHFIALELSGEIRFDTAANQMLQQAAKDDALKNQGMPPALAAKNLPANNNPADGTTEFDFILSHDDSTSTWAGALTIAASKNDKDGLLRFGTVPANDQDVPHNDFWFNFLGTAIVFAPLIDEVEKAVADKGTLERIGTSAGVLAALAGLASLDGKTIPNVVLQTENITLYGGTLSFSEGDAGVSSALMFDVEVDLYLNILNLVKTRPTKPVKVRYRSVGVKVSSRDASDHLMLPIYFDASKGYDINLTDPGTFKLPAGLDDIIQVVGARLARTNPLNLELDLAMKGDFGVVKIDKAKVRWPLSPLGTPQLTAFGATIDIPGALKATGYLDLSGKGVAGSLDVIIRPLGIRASAAINIQPVSDPATGRSATAVAVSLSVKFPVPIVLGSSGLGIYGFIGLFAMHFKRNKPEVQDWYVSVDGDPTAVAGDKNTLVGWEADIGHWAFAAGLILGTLDGGIILNLKGVIMLELPGPRLLFLMTANLLSSPPDLKGSKGGTIEATLDLDIGRQTITIGMKVDYAIAPFLEIVVPGQAFFDYNHPEAFYLDLGTIASLKPGSSQTPATVRVLDIFNGSGYLMIHGNGIPDFHPPAGGLTGLAVAAGVQAQLILGSVDANLYLEVKGSAALAISFSPFFACGKLSFEGSLHLFIVTIGASGSLTVTSKGDATTTTISGEVCGKVSFFFFDVSGCVSIRIGPDHAPTISSPGLLASVYLQSRSPVLLEGTGTDRPIDAKLLDAPGTETAMWSHDAVPIDAIPVLQFAFTPRIDPGFTSNTVLPPGPPPATSADGDGWVKRGPTFFRYTITNIELTPLHNTKALTVKVPATWRLLGGAPGGGDRGVELALLSWVPFATPSAVVSSPQLDTQIANTFATTCADVAPAAPVLWSFTRNANGQSPKGWVLTGVAALDPPGATRSCPPPLTLKVRELWRSTHAVADDVALTVPAYVMSRAVPCLPAATPTPKRSPVVDPKFNPADVLKLLAKSDAALAGFHLATASLDAVPVSHDVNRIVAPVPLSNADALGFAPPASPARPVPPTTPINPTRPVGPIGPIRPPTPVLRPTPVAPAAPTPDPDVSFPHLRNLRAALDPGSTVRADTGFVRSGSTKQPATCPGKLLVAPYQWRNDTPPGEPTDLLSMLMKAETLFDPVSKQNADLQDALLFETAQPNRVRLTLWLTAEIHRCGGLVIRALDAKGQKLADIPIDEKISGVLESHEGVPDAWKKNPWVAESYPPDETAFLLQDTVLLTMHNRGGVVVLAETKLPAGTASFILGLSPAGLAASPSTPLAYAVAAVEVTSDAETGRIVSDQAAQANQRKTIAAALTNGPKTSTDGSSTGGGKSNALPLLAPGGQYSLTVKYKVQTAPVDENGNRGKANAETTPDPATFFFRTDLQAPKNLHPWILAAWPCQDEQFFFYKEPVRVVFSTNSLVPLLDAYQVTVRARLRAASYRNHDLTATGPGKATQDLQPLAIDGVVFTSFEESLRHAVLKGALGCITDVSTKEKHSKQEFDVPMDPLTGYVFDLEESNAQPSDKPAFRASFSTSRYGTLADMAADIRGSRVRHRHVGNGGTTDLDGLEESCTQARMDAALAKAGFGAMPAAEAPVVTILWEEAPPSGGQARPAGVLLDLPEPVRRSRPTPTPTYADPATKDRVIAWSLQTQRWLDLAEAGVTPATPGIARRISITTAGTRAYVSLPSGLPASASLKLQLNRTMIYPIDQASYTQPTSLLTLALGVAPWEEA